MVQKRLTDEKTDTKNKPSPAGEGGRPSMATALSLLRKHHLVDEVLDSTHDLRKVRIKAF